MDKEKEKKAHKLSKEKKESSTAKKLLLQQEVEDKVKEATLQMKMGATALENQQRDLDMMVFETKVRGLIHELI